MKYITFNQALLAVGLIGLTVALTFLEGNSFAIAAALLVEDGPSIVGPVFLMVVSVAIPLGILAIAWRRVRTGPGDADPPGPLTYAQARLAIGLAGLVVLAALTPQVVVANSAAGWDGPAFDSTAYLALTLVVVAGILGSALGSLNRDTGPIDRSQLLVCVGLATLVVVAAVAPALGGVLVTGATDAPELRVLDASVALRVYSGVSLLLTLAVLLGIGMRGNSGTGWAVAVIVLLVGLAASVHLVYTLIIVLPLALLAATSYLAGTAQTGTAEPFRNGPLLVSLGLLSLAMSASSTKYVISLYHACSPFDASLYLWPTLALVVAVVFSLGILGTGVRKLRASPGDAEESWGE